MAFLQTPARAEVPREYQVKAVCLWRLAQFVDWPSNAFEKLDSPIVIGVFGANPFGDALDVAVRDETAHGRKLIVHYWQRVEEIRSCHILFISKPEAARFRKILAAVAGKNVLTVSDIDDFTDEHYGMVRFVSEQGRVKLRINLDAIQSARLAPDARLLRLAEIVKSR